MSTGPQPNALSDTTAVHNALAGRDTIQDGVNDMNRGIELTNEFQMPLRLSESFLAGPSPRP